LLQGHAIMIALFLDEHILVANHQRMLRRMQGLRR